MPRWLLRLQCLRLSKPPRRTPHAAPEGREPGVAEGPGGSRSGPGPPCGAPVRAGVWAEGGGRAGPSPEWTARLLGAAGGRAGACGLGGSGRPLGYLPAQADVASTRTGCRVS